MTIEALGKIYREMGIVGAGGAGFPTYAKLNNKAETILLNCAIRHASGASVGEQSWK
jgi:Na+-translocating ferredoxin:NAD+ oxidoreductase RnfC subunit